MKCKNCGVNNAPVKKCCSNCGKFLEGGCINNVTGKRGRRNADGSVTPYKPESSFTIQSFDHELLAKLIGGKGVETLDITIDEGLFTFKRIKEGVYEFTGTAK